MKFTQLCSVKHPSYGPRWGRSLGAAARIVAGGVLLGALFGNAQAAGTTTFTKIVTIPTPPASSFTGNSGGDGWAVALTPDAVYNVYHHQSLNVACHKQTDASNCWSSPSKSITDADGGSFYVPNHAGLALNQTTGHLFVYVTKTSDSSRGVACIDTSQPAAVDNPFCGYTPLSNTGDGGAANESPGNGVMVGTKFYAFNFVDGQIASGTQNKLMCFDTATETACSGQPFDLSLPASPGSGNGYTPAAAIGGKVVFPVGTTSGSLLACFDPSSGASCGGSWPVALPFSYSYGGAPFPLLNAAGAVTGLCLPDGNAECFALNGSAVAAPSGLAAAIGTTTGYNGPAAIIGARVYVASGNDNAVHCYDYSASAACVNFPHSLPNSGFTYTVNPDPQRPECLWTNADFGSAQIQNFDAFSGGSCGSGAIRVLASSFVPPDVACTPLSYTKLQVIDPVRTDYVDGNVSFRDGSGNPILGIADAPLDGTGSVSLTGLSLNTNGLPQFLITLNSPTIPAESVSVEMTWTGSDVPQCGGSPVMQRTRLKAYPSLIELLPSPQLTLHMSAKLTDKTGAPIAGQTISFLIGRRVVCSANTKPDGVATCEGRPVATLATIFTLGYRAKFGGFSEYLPSQDHGPVIGIRGPSS
jgi:hypothetical protein